MCATRIVEILRRHIQEEEETLFPLVDSTLSRIDNERIAVDMKKQDSAWTDRNVPRLLHQRLRLAEIADHDVNALLDNAVKTGVTFLFSQSEDDAPAGAKSIKSFASKPEVVIVQLADPDSEPGFDGHVQTTTSSHREPVDRPRCRYAATFC